MASIEVVMQTKNMTSYPESGFNLITVSIILTAAAVALAAALPGQKAGDSNQKTLTSLQKLEAVEKSMQGFILANGRRPCPADGQYSINNAKFGIEAATPGTCTGG